VLEVRHLSAKRRFSAANQPEQPFAWPYRVHPLLRPYLFLWIQPERSALPRRGRQRGSRV